MYRIYLISEIELFNFNPSPLGNFFVKEKTRALIIVMVNYASLNKVQMNPGIVTRKWPTNFVDSELDLDIFRCNGNL